MSELGQHLKQVREQKQVTLDDLQRTTKIQKRYLLAIEEGRFDTLPGLFYARAFVKTYAEAIGLDPEPLFDQYRNELPNPQREAAELPSRSERVKSNPVSTTKRKKATSFLPGLMAIVFILIVAFGIWLMLQGDESPENVVVTPDEGENLEADFSEEVEVSPEEDETAEPVDDAPEQEPAEEEPEREEEPEPDVVSELTFIESQGITSFYQLEGGEIFEAVVKFSGDSYMDVKNAKGKTFFSGQPTDGEKLTYDLSGEEQVEFNFGASQNVQLFVNEQEVEFPLDQVHQRINITFSLGEDAS